MKYYLLTLLASAALFAQSTAATYTVDLNGHRVPETLVTTSAKGEVTEVRQSLNGRKVPMQKTESRVITESPAGRTVETIVRKYDQDGNLAATERTVSDEQKRPGGGSSVHATIYRSDLNGRLVEAERRVIETQKQGALTTAEVNIARAGLSGSFETVEQRKVVTTAVPNGVKEDETVYRVNNGQLYEAVRRQHEEHTENGKTQATTTSFTPDFSGKMALNRQEVAVTKKAADGTETTELNIFLPTLDGLVAQSGRPPQLKEQQLVTRRPAADGSMTEVIAIRRPALGDPGHLGEAKVLSETVCSAACPATTTP